MKNILKLCLLLIAVGWTSVGFGQTCQTVGLTDNDMICGKYADINWDWESTNCKNWNYSVNGTVKNLPHPFISGSKAQSTRVVEIYELRDYKKANGWVLIQRNFGCGSVYQNVTTPSTYPYFILYNKYSAMLRVFVNAPNVNTDNMKYNYLFKLSSFNKASAVTSSSILKTPDKYLNNNITTEEALFYYHPESPGGWIVGEFNLNFDYNIKDAIYNNSKINLELFLLSEQSITAKINGQVITNSQYGGVNFSSSVNTTTTTTNQFEVAGKKVIQISENGAKSLEKMNKGIMELSTKVTSWSENTPSLKPYAQKLNNLSSVTNPKSGTIGKPVASFFDAVKSVGGAIGIVGEAFNIIDFVGDFTGWWNLFDNGTTSLGITPPSISTYDLSLNGAITSSQQKMKFIFTMPASINSTSSPSDLSYYDSPTGIFNLQNTITADRTKYNRFIGWSYYYTSNCFYVTNNKYTVSTKDYYYIKLNNSIVPIINNCSNKTFVGAQKAIFVKFDYDPLYKSDGFVVDRKEDPICGGAKNTHKTYNPFYYQIANNQLEIVRYDRVNNIYIFRTPYVDYKVNNLFIEAPTDAEYYVNILASFTDPSSTIPFVISKNYEINFNEIPNQQKSYQVPGPDNTSLNIDNLGLGEGQADFEKFIENFSTPYLANNLKFPTFFDKAIYDNTDNNSTNIWYLSDKGDGYSQNSIFRANNFVINNVSNLDNKKISAGSEVTISNSTLKNCEFTINNDFLSLYNNLSINNSINPIYTQFVCDSYNNLSQRQGNLSFEIDKEKPIIFPNPFIDNLTVNLSTYQNQQIKLSLVDLFGKEVFQKEFIVEQEQYDFDLSLLPTGIYLVKIENNSISETIKVIKQ